MSKDNSNKKPPIAPKPHLTQEKPWINFPPPPPGKPKPLVAPKSSPLVFAEKASHKITEAHLAKARNFKNAENFKNAINAERGTIKKSFASLSSAKDPVASMTSLLEELDKVANMRTGIDHTVIPAASGIAHIGGEKSRVVIRDARLQEERRNNPTLKDYVVNKPEDAYEASLATSVSVARGSVSIIDMDTNLTPALRNDMKKRIIALLDPYSVQLASMESQEMRNKAAAEFNTTVAKILRSKDLVIGGAHLASMPDLDLARAMVDARDFGNFNAPDHPTITTITGNIASDKAKPLYAVSTSTPLNPVGKELKKLYEEPLENQGWFKDLPPVRQALVKKYKDQILDGKHTIPTQLRDIVGLKNAYLETTSVVTPEGKVEKSVKQLRSANPTYNLGEGAYSQDITEKHVQHMQHLSGNLKPNLMTLNYDLGKTAGLLSKDVMTEHKITTGVKKVAAKLGLRSDNHVVNISLSKDKNFSLIANKFIETGKNEIQWDFCKSGKDRTGAVSANNSIAWIQHQLQDKVSEVGKAIIHSGHQEALAGSNSATVGAKGLKFVSISTGLSGRFNHIKEHQEQLSNSVSSLNAIHFTVPTQPDKKSSLFSQLSQGFSQLAKVFSPSMKKEKRINPEKFGTEVLQDVKAKARAVTSEIHGIQRDKKKAQEAEEKFSAKLDSRIKREEEREVKATKKQNLKEEAKAITEAVKALKQEAKSKKTPKILKSKTTEPTIIQRG